MLEFLELSEFWEDIDEYPTSHIQALSRELHLELPEEHILSAQTIKIIAKREDKDDVLVKTSTSYYVVHLTWSGKEELLPFPVTKEVVDLTLLDKV